MRNILFLTLLSLMVAGCATIISGTNQYIQIRVIDTKTNESITDFNCAVLESNGTKHSLNKDGSVLVTRSNAPLQITCNKDGFKASQMGIGSSFNSTTLLNIITAMGGFIVDAVTGAMYAYPSHFVIHLEKQ